MSTSCYRIGDRIKNIDPDTEKGRNYGQYGEVTAIWGDTVEVEYENGKVGSSANPTRYYQLVSASSAKKIMPSIKSFIKNIGLSKEEKLLRKHGLKNECGEYTDLSKEIVIASIMEENEDILVETAEAYEKEEKENNK